MLPPDLIKTTRRGERLSLVPLSGERRERAHEIAAQIIEILGAGVGESEEELRQSLSQIPHAAPESKLLQGLNKVALDLADFGARSELDSMTVRREVFRTASQRRAELGEDEPLPREAVLTEVAAALGQTPQELEDSLFSDLKGAAELRRFPRVSPDALLEAYELASLQGIFLAATELRVELTRVDTQEVRSLFRELKFRELLFQVDELEDRHRLVISGPMSVFGPRGRYGLRLAQLVPTLLGADFSKLGAALRWGKEHRELSFEVGPGVRPAALVATRGPELRPELAQLAAAPSFVEAGWSLAPADRILVAPRLGACVPDALCRRAGRDDVYLELLGYWSREAVFRRVEWARAQPGTRILFLVPARLRVSEEVMPEGLDARIHVFKTSINPRRLLEDLENLARGREPLGEVRTTPEEPLVTPEEAAAPPAHKSRRAARRAPKVPAGG